MKPKVIYDSIIYDLQKIGGISIYWHNLESRLMDNIFFHLKSYRFSNNKNIVVSNENITNLKKYVPKFLIHVMLKIEQIREFYVPDLNNTDLFHSSYYRVPSKKYKGKVITTIHDFIPEKYYPFFKKKITVYLKKKAINNSDAIICVSHNTKKDLINYYPKVLKEKIFVVYNGVDDTFKPMLKKKNNDLLYVGSRKQDYKNFNKMVSLISSLKGVSLNIVGSELTKREENMLNNFLPNRYKIFVNPDNLRLNQIYSMSFALIYPSDYEGFGIPVLESMKCGTPAILYSNEVFKELFHDSCVFMNDISVSSLNNAIKYVNSNYDSLVNSGIKKSKSFSWDLTANNTFDIYKKILEI